MLKLLFNAVVVAEHDITANNICPAELAQNSFHPVAQDCE
jgi:hypothetical protein